MSTTSSPPDAAQLAESALPTSPFPGLAGGALRVYFDATVFNAVTQHARESAPIEVCGVLVGAWRRDESGPFVHISASIRGDAATSKFAEVTFTHETWARINERMDREFADQVIVGWYHTHPDFGVFLSERDLFIHQHFFCAPGQVALVVDPVRGEEGVFIWRHGAAVLAPTHWVGDEQRWSPRPPDHGGAAKGPGQHAARSKRETETTAEIRSAESPRPPWQSALLPAAMLGLFAAGYLFAVARAATDQQAVVDGLAAQLYRRTDSIVALQRLGEVRRAIDDMAEIRRQLVPVQEGAPLDYEKLGGSIDATLQRAHSALQRAMATHELRRDQLDAIDMLVVQRVRDIERAEANRRQAASGGTRTGADATAPSGNPSTTPALTAPATTQPGRQ